MSAGTADLCPTPLAWHDVVAAFRAECRPWRIAGARGTVAGCSWGSGSPLFFLSGFLGDRELFALTAWVLRGEFRCVFLDETPAGTLAEWVDDLLVAAEEQGDERFSLCAASFGTAAALTAMCCAPERIERAVLVHGFARRTWSRCERLLIRVGRCLPGRVSRLPLWRAIQEQNHRRWFPPFDAGRWEFYLENAGRTPIRALAARAALIHRWDVRARLGEITTPVLLVRGEGAGQVAAGDFEVLRAGLPQTETAVLHSTGHLPFLTHPHRLGKLVRDFLRHDPQFGKQAPAAEGVGGDAG